MCFSSLRDTRFSAVTYGNSGVGIAAHLLQHLHDKCGGRLGDGSHQVHTKAHDYAKRPPTHTHYNMSYSIYNTTCNCSPPSISFTPFLFTKPPLCAVFPPHRHESLVCLVILSGGCGFLMFLFTHQNVVQNVET